MRKPSAGCGESIKVGRAIIGWIAVPIVGLVFALVVLSWLFGR
jgi:hypothetical protein